MMDNTTKVVKNASVMMISQLLTWLLSLVLAIYLPRFLGATAVGEFALANAIWAIMGMLIGCGTDTLLTKEIARQPERTATLVGTALVLRITLFIVGAVIVAVYIYIMGYPSTTSNIIWIAGAAILISQLTFVCWSALQGLEAMHLTSIANVATKAIYTVLGVAVVLAGYSIYAVGFANIIATLIGAVLLLIFLRRYYSPKIQLDARSARSMARAGFPYLLTGMGVIIYNQVDVLIISMLINTTEIGWYAAASQLFSTLLFIPVVFTAAVFPILTRTYANAPDSLPKIIGKTFDLMMLTSIPIGLGIFVVAPKIVVLLFGPAFTQSGPILAMMGIVLIFTYLNILIGQFLISTDRQNRWTIVMIVAAVLTAPLDLVLVPWCQTQFGNGAIGGALSYTITECAMVVVGIVLLPSGALNRTNIYKASRIIAAGLVMAVVSWWSRDMFIGIPIIIGALTYIGMIAVLRVVPEEDLILFKRLTKGIVDKFRRRTSEPVGTTGA